MIRYRHVIGGTNPQIPDMASTSRLNVAVGGAMTTVGAPTGSHAHKHTPAHVEMRTAGSRRGTEAAADLSSMKSGLSVEEARGGSDSSSPSAVTGWRGFSSKDSAAQRPERTSRTKSHTR